MSFGLRVLTMVLFTAGMVLLSKVVGFNIAVLTGLSTILVSVIELTDTVEKGNKDGK